MKTLREQLIQVKDDIDKSKWELSPEACNIIQQLWDIVDKLLIDNKSLRSDNEIEEERWITSFIS